LRIDNLKLRSLVDKRLAELSDNNTAAPILYSPEYDGASVFAISGDYTITGKEISVSLLLTKGGTEIQTRLEIKELTANLDLLSRRITAAVMDWLKNH